VLVDCEELTLLGTELFREFTIVELELRKLESIIVRLELLGRKAVVFVEFRELGIKEFGSEIKVSAFKIESVVQFAQLAI